MADKEQLAILRKGVDAWNTWREDNPDVKPSLREADLREANLREANLIEADLSGAYLSEAILSGAHLSEADLDGADLSGAHLGGANLSGAYLSQAILSGANLREANLNRANLSFATLNRTGLGGANLREANLLGAYLSGANLSQANLSQADLGLTTVANVDLSTVQGLDTVIHQAPSTIGIDTIYRSGGNIPEVFLRGCGVPDTFIEYMTSLVGKPIEFYSCFISYSTKNQDFADRLYADLQAKGVRCWFAPEDVQGGKKLHEQIEQAIRRYEKLLLVLSEHSMSSEWVKTEIYHARQQETKSGRRKLFPVSLVPFETIRSWKAFDADSGKDMAREVREYFVPDFLNWKDHDAYQKTFDRLLRDLKVDPS